MDLLKNYDDADPKSIESYAKKLINHTFEEVLQWNKPLELRETSVIDAYENKARKGGLGNLIEKEYFGYEPNSNPEPDFPKAGVELKVSPYEKKKNGELKAGERLVLGMISYETPIEDSFFDSHAWQKCKLILLIYYLRDKTLESNLKYMINFASLFTPTEEDLAIIKSDYKIISDKIKAGKAHELSEGDTMYLGACTKGATAEKSTVAQYYNAEIKAKKRAFCLKNSYMTYVLNNYITKGKDTYEAVIKNTEQLEDYTFGDLIIERIKPYVGKTDRELCDCFGMQYKRDKAQWTNLSYKMLGIKSNRAEEFKKANIVVKSIRIEKNGKMTESSPLPTFAFKEIIKQEWEESDLYNYFSETKFLFIVFEDSGSDYVLKGVKLWNMPYRDFETVRKGWEKTCEIIKNGVEWKEKKTANGIIIENNFPSKQENEIIHVRPHASKRFYVYKDGTTLGNGNMTYADELPDGRFMTKQSFWINNSYIVEQINELI